MRDFKGLQSPATLLNKFPGSLVCHFVVTSKFLLSASSRELEHCFMWPWCRESLAISRWASSELVSWSMHRCSKVWADSTSPVRVGLTVRCVGGSSAHWGYQYPAILRYPCHTWLYYCDTLVIPGYIVIPDQYVDTTSYKYWSKLICIALEASNYLTTIQCNKRSVNGSAQHEFWTLSFCVANMCPALVNPIQ